MLQRTYTQMPLKEISKISCTCRECKTEILVDMNENADREEAIQELEKGVSDLRAKFCGRSGGYDRYLRRLTRILGVQVQRMSNAIGRIFQRERR